MASLDCESPTASRTAVDTTLLIVDDEPRILDSVRMNLELEGYQVFEATNGQEALDGSGGACRTWW